MGLVKFRNIYHKDLEKDGPKASKDSKLSFRKLADDWNKSASTIAQPLKSNRSQNRAILYKIAVNYLNHAMSAVKNRKGFPLEPGFRILQKMAEVDHPRDELFIMAIHMDNRFKYAIYHSVNVAIYTLKIAQDLGFDKTKKLEIAMAALLHDIGLALIPDNIIHKQDELSQAEINILNERPNYSYKILRSLGDEFAYLAEIAAQVYERIDGSGYPRGLKGDEIHEYAQIIGLLDMYEALIHSRPQRVKLTPFAAIKEIINTRKNLFQRKHFKSLLNVFTVFPIFSHVRLNSNAIGKVIETYPDQPMRPKLRILYDSQRRKVLTKRIVVLPDNPLLNIVDSVSEGEIQQLSERQ